MKDAGLPEPIFQKEGIFNVILFKPSNVSGQTTQKTAQKTTQKTTQKTEARIIEIFTLNPHRI
jgi:predicted HTH transcriptional regulator